MQRGKAFFVVGHKHWGKSKTLKALTDNRRVGWFEINAAWFFIRRMSNDDIPDEFYELLNNLEPVKKPFVIIALCPTFEDQEKCEELLNALKDFKRKYELHFFVLQHAFLDDRQISEKELAHLKDFGTVQKLSRKADKEERGRAFEKFILANI
ncbi:MAG TPA: hypothetical protein VHA33_04915 [Candidatus Angelobacter sp.]|jgi:hypothetical protein|nr:hypothetical protein [Candidatus Angelobacter sp.]